VRRHLAFFIGGVRVGRVGHLTVASAAGVLAKTLVLEAVGVSDVMEWCEGEYELVVTNKGTVTG
jgi:hypothetical protein